MYLKGDSFPFEKEQAQTLMLISFVEAFLARNQNIGTTRILGARRTNHNLVEIMSEVLYAMTSE